MNADDLARILDELGRRLGPTGEYVFALAVRQQMIDGIVYLVVLFALAILATVLSLFARTGIAQYNATHPDPSEYLGPTWRLAAYLGIWSAFLIMLALIGPSTLGKLLNAEWAALRGILEAIR